MQLFNQERRDNTDEQDGGFTLIELMVVLLIMAILLAIAVPTFLGTRASAQERSAQSNLENALVAAKTLYNNDSSFGSNIGGLAGELSSIEPSLSFTTGAAQGGNSIAVYAAPYWTASQEPSVTFQAIVVVALAADNTCWAIVDSEQSNEPIDGFNGPGIAYAGWTGGSCYATLSDVSWQSSFPGSPSFIGLDSTVKTFNADLSAVGSDASPPFTGEVANCTRLEADASTIEQEPSASSSMVSAMQAESQAAQDCVTGITNNDTPMIVQSGNEFASASSLLWPAESSIGLNATDTNAPPAQL